MPLVRASLPVGIVVRRSPGVTRWAKWSWKVVAVLPGAGPANWHELRSEGDVAEYHAATLTLDLWSSDTEAYQVGLSGKTPGLIVVLQEDREGTSDMPWIATHITASPYEGQDYKTIVSIAAKLPDNVLHEDEKLVMYYDVASTRLGDE